MMFERFFPKKIEAIRPESAIDVLSYLTGKKISYYNYRALPYAEAVKYAERAREILENETFKNELNCLLTDLKEEIALRSKSYEEVQNLRMTINGLKILVERLESINVSTPEETFEDVHSGL